MTNEERISEIEQRLRSAQSLSEQSREDLLALLAALKNEISRMSDALSENADSIAGFVDISTREATRGKKDQTLLDLSLKGLSSSVQEFETSHPKLAETVNGISTMLADLGI